MSLNHGRILIAAASVFLAAAGCNVFLSPDLEQPAQLAPPEGIDPRNPNTERTSSLVDFSGVKTIRIEIATGRVSVSQSQGSGQASLAVTEVIVAQGLSNEALAERLIGSRISAERSFVDETRLDIKATIAPGLADTDIAFDIRLVIPSGANIEILLANGQVEVTDLVGNIEIRTANGAVSITKVTGNVVARTTMRSITVADVSGNVQVETSGADISLRLAPAPGGVVTANTSEGAIRLAIAQDTAARLSLSAPEGTVTANLGGFAVSNLSTANGFLAGVLNGGGGRIEAVAAQGEIEFIGI